jgi:4-diphosphocytidyl-2-C-methyl-D-erythritol kinase
MKQLHEQAFAKINLSLDVLGRMPDGYHSMETVMQGIDLRDKVELTLREDGALSVQSNFHFLPCDQRNLAWRAARLLLDRAGSPLGVDIRLHKRIPVGAGLAGGSADAAAVLRGMNRLLDLGLTGAELESLGRELGSDVPFCVRGGTAVGRGRGEVLTDLPAPPDCAVLVCKPRFSISTPKLFARLDQSKCPRHPDTPGLLSTLERGDLLGLSQRMYNVFEEALPPSMGREIAAIKSRMLDCGALGAVMTGTGSAVIGLFAPDGTGEAARAHLEGQYAFCALCRTLPRLKIS